MIRALIFDFDGMILDTEGPFFQSWQELFAEVGSTWRYQPLGDYKGLLNHPGV